MTGNKSSFRVEVQTGFLVLLLLATAGAGHLGAANIGVSLASDALPSQPVASTGHWTAVSDPATAGLQYQFSVSPIGGVPNVPRSFHASNSFEWTPMVEGVYKVAVAVRDANGNTGEASAAVIVTSRLTQPDAPAVSATANPLVALYSAPACGDGGGGSVRAIVHPAANMAKWYSPYKNCVAGKTLNFLMAGMLPNTKYILQQERASPGQPTKLGPEIAFTTGPIPASANLPTAMVLHPKDSATDAAQPVLLTSYIATMPGQSATPVATDSKGRVIWYYGAADKPLRYLARPLAGGTMFALPQDPTLFREIDLAGNTIRETNTGWISEQLQTRFRMPGITSFHHDAVRLPDGSIAAIASVEKVLNGVQGSAGPVDVLGDAIVVMDKNFNVTWAWNSFDKLDVNRAAVLGETCVAAQPGCPPVQTVANDWLHSNSLEYLPDGNFLLSLRHQDWVVKIDYRNGTGTGDVLWRLGKDGDFAMNSSVADPWFSHQHNVTLGGNSVWLFDNGNTRHHADAAANSRGQVLSVDEAARTASIVLNADLGNYSPALGSAQRLDNGDYHFLAGNLSNGHSQSVEIVSGGVTGIADFTVDTPNPAYRSFRMKNLWTP